MIQVIKCLRTLLQQLDKQERGIRVLLGTQCQINNQKTQSQRTHITANCSNHSISIYKQNYLAIIFFSYGGTKKKDLMRFEKSLMGFVMKLQPKTIYSILSAEIGWVHKMFYCLPKQQISSPKLYILVGSQERWLFFHLKAELQSVSDISKFYAHFLPLFSVRKREK